LIRRVVAVAALSGSAVLIAGLIHSHSALASTRPASATLRAEPTIYRATGVIRAFGPERTYVNIAHDEIAGYMGAMTMSFWPRAKEQLDGLSVGDPVVFEFTETEDARRVLSSIRKRM
jgi:Cu/Ag efflux protein CusF